jgi:large subunit ribosomal protein L28
MPRVCHITGAKTRSGNKITRRGKAKYLGGVGIKTTSVTKRTFKPNLQRVDAVIDGAPKRILVTARAIKRGMIQKPTRRKYVYTRTQKAAAAA